MQGLGGDYYSTSAGQRERMLTATQKLENQNQKLLEARVTLAQTEVSLVPLAVGRRGNNLLCGAPTLLWWCLESWDVLGFASWCMGATRCCQAWTQVSSMAALNRQGAAGISDVMCLPCCTALIWQDVGAGILKDLHSQRETILRSRQTLQGADDNIGKARKVLSGMARRVMQNKIIMFGIIVFLLAAIALILYFKLR